MKDFVKKVQADLTKLQKTIEKESDQLLAKLKSVGSKKALNKKADEIEKMIEKQIDRFEPAISKFAKDVKTNAAKYGFDLGDIEKKVHSAAKAAKTTLKKARGKTANASTASKTVVKKKAHTKKHTRTPDREQSSDADE